MHGGERILTGHDNGLITIDLAEADAPSARSMRAEMGEPYRTLLGHFRHEIGHYFWDRLVRDGNARLEASASCSATTARTTTQALRATTGTARRPTGADHFVSPYASSHPWEDWAETWAHYLHIVDTLEMVHALNFPLGRLETVEANDLPRGDTGGRLAGGAV